MAQCAFSDPGKLKQATKAVPERGKKPDHLPLLLRRVNTCIVAVSIHIDATERLDWCACFLDFTFQQLKQLHGKGMSGKGGYIQMKTSRYSPTTTSNINTTYFCSWFSNKSNTPLERRKSRVWNIGIITL